MCVAYVGAVSSVSQHPTSSTGGGTAAGGHVTGGYVAGVHAARALAITLVLAAHIIGLWTNHEQFRWWVWQAYLGLIIDPLRIDHQAGGHMGLLLFFLVSGYIVSQAAEGESRYAFIVKRTARLVPVMALAVGVTLLVATLGRHLGWTPVEGFDAARAYAGWTVAEALGLGLFFGGNGVLFVLWSLHVEYWWYLLLTVFSGLVRRRPVTATLVMAAVASALALPGTDPGLGPLHVSSSLMTYLFVILIGRWIYLHTHLGLNAGWAALGGALMFAAYVGGRWRYDGRELVSGEHPRALAVLWATAIFCLLLRYVRGNLWRPVTFIGDISYGLYVFHIPVMWLVLPVVSPGGRWFPLGVAVTVATLLVVAWSSYRYVETPIRRLARQHLATTRRIQ